MSNYRSGTLVGTVGVDSGQIMIIDRCAMSPGPPALTSPCNRGKTDTMSNDKHYTPQRAAAREKRMLAKALDQKFIPVTIDGHQEWVPKWPQEDAS